MRLEDDTFVSHSENSNIVRTVMPFFRDLIWRPDKPITFVHWLLKSDILLAFLASI